MGQPRPGVTHHGELGVGERIPWRMVLSIVFVCCFVRHNGKSMSRGGTKELKLRRYSLIFGRWQHYDGQAKWHFGGF